MAFYGSTYPNGLLWRRHARHIACPQRLKYIHDIKAGYIPCVEDSDFTDRLPYRKSFPPIGRLGLYNTAEVWRQELMGMAQQVQSTLVPVDERTQRCRSSRLPSYRSKKSSCSIENDEQDISKRLLNRYTSARPLSTYLTKPKICIDKIEQDPTTNNENQDPGIWLLPILCHILHVDDILEAQEWLINASPTEKRLAMDLISRTMSDMKNHENSIPTDSSTCDQSITSSSTSNFNNVYWPYKFWQYQHQASKISLDSTDTCERGTSPVRILTPAARLLTPMPTDRTPTPLTSSRSNERCLSSRLSTPITANSSDRHSRRSHRITTSRGVLTENDYKPVSANFRGKTPLI